MFSDRREKRKRREQSRKQKREKPKAIDLYGKRKRKRGQSPSRSKKPKRRDPISPFPETPPRRKKSKKAKLEDDGPYYEGWEEENSPRATEIADLSESTASSERRRLHAEAVLEAMYDDDDGYDDEEIDDDDFPPAVTPSNKRRRKEPIVVSDSASASASGSDTRVSPPQPRRSTRAARRRLSFSRESSPMVAASERSKSRHEARVEGTKTALYVHGLPASTEDTRFAAVTACTSIVRSVDWPARLSASIKGQKGALALVARAVRLFPMKCAIDSPVTLLLAGPSGVGKTATLECVASALGVLETPAFVRFSGTLVQNDHEVSQVTGASPNFAGFESGGSLAERLHAAEKWTREAPIRLPVLLFIDEFDKAHPDVATSLMHLMETGHVQGANGISFRMECAMVVLASNDGAAATGDAKAAIVEDMVARGLQPYHVGRITAVVPFESLALHEVCSAVRAHADVMWGKLSRHVWASSPGVPSRERDLELSLDAGFVDAVADAYTVKHGMRPVMDALADRLTEVTDEAAMRLKDMDRGTRKDVVGLTVSSDEWTFM